MERSIQTKYGSVEGSGRNGCSVYLGIPFAKPPEGSLAFRHPLPPNPWQDTLKAVRGSANPIQAPGNFAIGNNSLDCLYLNVFVPEWNRQPKPVMVWIYGGAYNRGGAGAEEKNTGKLQYDLSRFAAETGCIAVSFNYRLNLYGFLNLNWMDPGFDRNNGLYDQLMALRFVKENIAAFGGDPDNITLFGQSAGAASILALMGMREADGLFHRVILQSACFEHFFTESESRTNAEAYLRFAGVRHPEELLLLDEKAVWAANRKYGAWMFRKGEIRCAFSPVIDGMTLTGEPKELAKQSRLPMLIGNVSQEANLFAAKIPWLLLPFVPRYIHLKPARKTGGYRQRISDALTDHIYVRPQMEILDSYCGDSWRYEYRHVLQGSRLGCYHTSELPVLFGFEAEGNRTDPETERVGQEMRAIWGSFAKSGTPGWEKYRKGSGPYRIE